MRPICVKIDLERLRERLSREQGRRLDGQLVHQWLHEAGFVLVGSWSCDRDGPLQRLRPDEVLEVVRDVVDNGVHYVNRQRM